MTIKSTVFYVFVACLFSCSSPQENTTDNGQTPNEELVLLPTPKFNEDSAYRFVQNQVDFGARVPNSDAHRRCATYLENELKRFGLETIVQSFEVEAYNGATLNAKNIIATFRPDASRRILLAAHWDTRHLADQDSNRKNEPILGANDGGSGVGVLLEIARTLTTDSLKTDVGVDIIFFDVEDFGQPDNDKTNGNKPDSWCLGSQYWAKNKHKPNYMAYYGILLDMVGAPNAKFYQEGQSMKFAPSIVQKVWKTAHKLGYSTYFANETVSPLTDDHLYVNEIAAIPMIDIIQYHPQAGFGDFWHTHKDNMNAVDKNTLKVVGQTVLQVIFNEKTTPNL